MCNAREVESVPVNTKKVAREWLKVGLVGCLTGCFRGVFAGRLVARQCELDDQCYVHEHFGHGVQPLIGHGVQELFGLWLVFRFASFWPGFG